MDDADFGHAAEGRFVEQGFHLVQGIVNPLAAQVKVGLNLARGGSAVIDAGIPVVPEPDAGSVGVYAGGGKGQFGVAGGDSPG